MHTRVIGHDHIDAMLTYAIDAGLEYELASGIPVPFLPGNATMLGRIVLLANAEALRPACRLVALTAETIAHAYSYRPLREPISAPQAAKLADTVDRCCSGDGRWDNTLAQRITWGARPRGGHWGPAYDAAPAHYRRAPRAAA